MPLSKPHVVPSASEMQVISTPNDYTPNNSISWCCFLPCHLQLTAVPNRENTEQDPGVRCMKQAAFACIMSPICRPPNRLMILLFCRLVLSRPRRGLGSDHSTTLDPDSHRWFMRTVSCHARVTRECLPTTITWRHINWLDSSGLACPHRVTREVCPYAVVG